MTKPARLVLVEWLDSRHPESSWQHLTDIPKPKPVSCVSVGWLIHDGKKAKALAQSFADMDDPKNIQASGVVHIPTCCVVRIVNLKEPKLKKAG